MTEIVERERETDWIFERSKINKELAMLVEEYVVIGEYEVDAKTKAVLSLSTVIDTDGKPLKLLRRVEGKMDENLEKCLGKREVKMQDTERELLSQIVESDAPLELLVPYAFSDPEKFQRVSYMFPHLDGEEDSTLVMGFIGPANTEKTKLATLFMRNKDSKAKNALAFEYDVFSDRGYYDYLMGTYKRLPYGQYGLSRNELDEIVEEVWTNDSHVKTNLSSKTLRYVLDRATFMLGMNRYVSEDKKSVVILDIPETFNYAQSGRGADVFDLFALQGMGSKYHIREHGRMIVDHPDKFEKWLEVEKKNDKKVRSVLKEYLEI